MPPAVPARILVVEDEPTIAELLVDYLRHAGHQAQALAHGNDLPQRVRSDPPDLLLLDLMLPGRDGLSLCREIRGFSAIPIILVTARVDELDRLLGLDSGADDYICKPFSPREVVARVGALLRRVRLDSGQAPQQRLVVDADRQRIVVHDGAGPPQPLDLTDTEYRMLHALMKRPGVILTRSQLLDHARGQDAATFDRAVDSHIKNLRRKLAERLPQQPCIHSVYGVGYRFEWLTA
jgi:two-component system response regulator BaeR